jgi:predicted Zn-ribbon and HTH transcriptional regulator
MGAVEDAIIRSSEKWAKKMDKITRRDEMNNIYKIKKYIQEKHSINCALTDEIIEFIDGLSGESSLGLQDVRELIEKHKIKTSEKSSEQFRHDAEIYNSAFDFILKFILQLEKTIQCPKCKTKLIETEEFIDGFPLPYYVFCCSKCGFEISMEELNKLPAPPGTDKG